jgi:hypothetical protein
MYKNENAKIEGTWHKPTANSNKSSNFMPKRCRKTKISAHLKH